MRGLRRYRVYVFVFFLMYPLFSGTVLLFKFNKTSNEIFPFFSWALFCFVPSDVDDLGIMVVELDGNAVAIPYYLEERTDLFPNAASATTYLRTQRISRTRREMDKHRKFVESSVFSGRFHEARYRVMSRTYDCLEKWRDDTSMNEEVLYDVHWVAEH